MRLVLIILPVALLAGLVAAAEPPEAPVSPADVIIACAADLTSAREVIGPDGNKALVPAVDPENARTTRYLWIDVEPSQREVVKRVADGHLNLLNRRGKKVGVRVNPWLVRINTLDYGEQFAKAWEKLGTGVDWVFHDEEFTERLEDYYETVDYGFWVRPDGSKRPGGSQKFADEKWETTRTEKVKKQRVVKEKGIAAWVVDNPKAKAALETIQAKTGGTDVPVVQWSQFFWETAIQEDRKVGYYGMLGLKSLKDYERLIGFTRRDIDQEKLAEAREVVSKSAVTHPKTLRRIVRLAAVGGDYWFTQDSNQDKVKDRQKGNPKFNHGEDYEFQAVEAIGNLPNDMPATALANDKGELQDKAPDVIATDDTSSSTDRNVHVNLSCVRCHSVGMMKDVRGWVKNVGNLPPNVLNGRSAEEQRRLTEFYVERRIEPSIRTYRERVDGACFEITGMKFAAFSSAYAKEWQRVEGPVTLEEAARRLGTTPAAYRAALIRQGPSVHPSLADHRGDKPESVPAIEFSQAYAFAQYAVHGKIKPFKVEAKEK